MLQRVRCTSEQLEDRGQAPVAERCPVPGFPGALPGSISRREPGRGEDVGAMGPKEGQTL